MQSIPPKTRPESALFTFDPGHGSTHARTSNFEPPTLENALTAAESCIIVKFPDNQALDSESLMCKIIRGSPTPHAYVLLVCLLLAPGAATLAQIPGRPAENPLNQDMSAPVLVEVSVRDAGGTPLGIGALVRLYTRMGSYERRTATRDASTASFSDVTPGEYEIEAQSPGYRTGTEHASVMGGGIRATFYIFLQPEDEAAGGNSPPGAPVMAPRLEREIEKALQKMRKQQFAEALAMLQKAAKIAPGNPDVHYLMGMANSSLKHLEDARTEFQAALTIYPAHERSLLALGELELRTGHPDVAVKVLEKAFQLNGADWRMHLLLANAYFDVGQYEKAEKRAARSMELRKEKNAEAQLLMAQILAARGQTAEAKSAFDRVVRDFPNDPAAAVARAKLVGFDTPKPESAPVPGPNAAALADLPLLAPPPPATVKSWAPAHIDSKEYALATDVGCADTEVLARAQQRMKKQLENFEKFTATEHITHVSVNSDGIPGTPREKDFSYMVTLFRAGNGITYLEESRDGGESLDKFPTSMATKGLVSLGVAILDRNYEGDFVYSCDGLASWHGEPAWQVRFEQKKEIPSRIFVWRNNRGSFPIPLRGRLWVSANSYDLIHLETDLREPVQILFLTLSHLVVDYGPVRFDYGGTSLWLPWHADAYMEVRTKRFHFTHTLTNYMLFSVETDNKVAAPKDIPKETEEQP